MTKTNEIRVDYVAAIRAKARKDARRDGWPSDPSRRAGWSDEAWRIYAEEYRGEMHAIDMGF